MAQYNYAKFDVSAGICIKYLMLYTYLWLTKGLITSMIIVVMPLISLMINQKDKFIKKGIRAEFVGQAQVEQAAI